MSAFVTADTHFGHAKSLSFMQSDGSPLRPFSSCEEMDETMVERWNATVGKKDTIYHLGDVIIPRSSLSILGRLNGRKILIKGNHDQHVKLSEWAKYFEDVRGAFFHPGDSTMRGGLIFTHVPVHPSCLSGHYLGNVHGHLHCHQIIDDGKVDRRYYNCCVERHNFSPVALDEIKAFFKGHDRKADVQHSP
jgi:calcineurin-like phosphoesterase family protein